MTRQIIILKNHIQKIGGLEKNLWRICDFFKKKNFDITLLSSEKSTLSFPVYTTSLKRLPSFLKILKFDHFCKKWLKNKKPEIVLAMDRTTCQSHIRAGNGVHQFYLEMRKKMDPFFKKISFSINPLHQTILLQEKKAFESPQLKALLVNSNMVKQQILDYYNVDPHKIKVVHNGVEWQEMATDFSNWEKDKILTAQNHNLDPEKLTFLFIGNGFKRKGMDFILLALSKLKRKDYQLLIIGKDKKIHFYKKMCKNLHLEKNVHFLDCKENIQPYYQLADILILPSFYDPFANVTIEALAMGLFVITSKYNGGCEVLNSKSGIIIDNLFDIDEFVYLLEKNLDRFKTNTTARTLRKSVEHLDYNYQLKSFANQCINNI